MPRILSTGLLVLVLGALGSPSAARPLDDPDVASAWRTLRAMDCARCHGASYLGSSGPSIVEYARAQSREAFLRAVLDGEPTRGMPGYRLRKRTVEHVFGTLKAWMGSTHFLTKTLPRVRTEMSLQVLAYNLQRAIRLLGAAKLIAEMRA